MGASNQEGYLVNERVEMAYSQLEARTPAVRERAHEVLGELENWLDYMETEFAGYGWEGLIEQMNDRIQERKVRR